MTFGPANIFEPIAMLNRIIRNGRQLADDPVLRRWLIGRAVGKYAGEPTFAPHRPPYLADLLPLDLSPSMSPRTFASLPELEPRHPISLPLPGLDMRLEPGDQGLLFGKEFDDFETYLAVHRFAWLPLLSDGIDPAWLAAIWDAWISGYGEHAGGWPWHPYSATERAVNIIHFCRRHGLLGDAEKTFLMLRRHGTAIAKTLEYFGDHHTSNHLANNGRGLYLIGIALGIGTFEELGRRILLAEAERLFMPSGMLREGSSHYHLLLTRNYVEVWLAARDERMVEAAKFEEIARRLLSAAKALAMPARFPLIGDISPDCPPDYLTCLVSGESKGSDWLNSLDDDQAKAVKALIQTAPVASPQSLGEDGWMLRNDDPWSLMFHAAPEGWSHMPGHGHQDCGGFELHYLDETLFVDPGRGSYSDTADAALYVSGKMHNGILIDGRDPYPPNKPYYDGAFRRRFANPVPEFNCSDNTVTLEFGGPSHQIRRQCSIKDTQITFSDEIAGGGVHWIERRLHTPFEPRRSGGGVRIKTQRRSFTVEFGGENEIAIEPATLWNSYGKGQSGFAINIRCHAKLPWSGTITIMASDE